MAAGVPVIATPVGAIPDVVTDGIHGFLVPARDGKSIAESLALMAGDRERLAWMSRACRRRIRAAFSIDRLAQELALRYAQLCGQVDVAGAVNGRIAGTVAKSDAPPVAKRRLAGRKD
jgi:glycosyltransferase involved in cell wall biosynthesis